MGEVELFRHQPVTAPAGQSSWLAGGVVVLALHVAQVFRWRSANTAVDALPVDGFVDGRELGVGHVAQRYGVLRDVAWRAASDARLGPGRLALEKAALRPAAAPLAGPILS